MSASLLALVFVAFVEGQGSLPVGKVIAEVRTSADESQGYALYLPASYSIARPWPLIVVFDPAARRAAAVERFQAAAECYGYIVVGFNNSRNGIPNGASVISALVTDMLGRFAIDQRRVYTAGMSGGARVAIG